MSTATTHWRPDTCPCEIDYTWDTSVDPSLRVHVLATITACQFHNTIANPQSVYNQVIAENTRKNIVVEQGQVILGAAITPNTPLPPFTYGTAKGTQRPLTISYTGSNMLSAVNQVALQSFCDAQFGTGQVIVSTTTLPVITTGSTVAL